MSENKNTNRHLELSSKFLEMGQALMNEGNQTDDYAVSQAGNFMVLLGGLVLNEDDMYEFGQLCSMFSAKKILDDLEGSDIMKLIKGDDDETYNEIMKKLKRLKDGDSGESEENKD